MRNVLFLCTGNSARSVMAESYLTHAGGGAWRGWSAGSNPTGTPNPFAFKTLLAHGIAPASGDGGPVRSKSWDEFAAADAPVLDVIVTVCDNAAGETCPVWPTRPGSSAPQKVHCSFPDPAAATGSDDDRRAAFEAVFADIRACIDAFLAAQK